MFRIIVLLFGLTLHWSSQPDLDFLNTVSTRTLQLRFWENEVLGTSCGIVNQKYLPCQKHLVAIEKAKLNEFEQKIPNMKMVSGDLYDFRGGKEILYRRVSFNNCYKYRISRQWFNQKLREYFNVYRRRVDVWFLKWERMSGKRETEREWNVNTLALKIKIIGESQYQ